MNQSPINNHRSKISHKLLIITGAVLYQLIKKIMDTKLFMSISNSQKKATKKVALMFLNWHQMPL